MKTWFWFVVARALNWIGAGVAAWALFWPVPYLLAVSVAAALPPLGFLIHLLGGGALRFRTEPSDPRPSISWLFGPPAFALVSRMFLDCEYLDWVPLLEWSAAAGLAIFLFALLRERTLRRTSDGVLLSLFVALTYSLGMVGLANVLFDNSAPQTFRVSVIDTKFLYTNHQEYFVKVSPWGPFSDYNDIRVSDAVYSRTHAGDTVCVYQGKGRLGFRWYELGKCRHS